VDSKLLKPVEVFVAVNHLIFILLFVLACVLLVVSDVLFIESS
jgi:hypothetical protein